MHVLIGIALKSLFIAGLTIGLLELMKRRSAAERSWVAHIGLLALVLLDGLAMTRQPSMVGLRDDKDACPLEKGPVDHDPTKSGCPRDVRVNDDSIVLLRQVEFDTATAKIRRSASAGRNGARIRSMKTHLSHSPHQWVNRLARSV